MVAGLAAADPLAAHLVIVRHLHDGSLRARAVVKHFALQCNLGGNLVSMESTMACKARRCLRNTERCELQYDSSHGMTKYISLFF